MAIASQQCHALGQQAADQFAQRKHRLDVALPGRHVDGRRQDGVGDRQAAPERHQRPDGRHLNSQHALQWSVQSETEGGVHPTCTTAEHVGDWGRAGRQAQ